MSPLATASRARRTRRAALTARPLRWRSARSPWPIPRTASPPASASKRRTERRCALPSNPGKRSMADTYTPRLKKAYEERIAKAMTEKFGYTNRFEVPKLEKITLNMGVGEASQDKKKVQTAAEEMELIAGQKPVITKAKKSIAQFKLREGMPIGCKV